MKITSRVPMLLLITAFSVGCGLGQGGAGAADPWVGTWKLNEQKSKLPPGGLGPIGATPFVSRTMTIEEIGPDKYRTIFDDTDGNGQKRRTESVQVCDGQERPRVERGPGYTESCRHIDTSTDRIVRKKDGKSVFEITARISQDGKVQTLNEKGVRNGQPFEGVFVFEKQ